MKRIYKGKKSKIVSIPLTNKKVPFKVYVVRKIGTNLYFNGITNPFSSEYCKFFKTLASAKSSIMAYRNFIIDWKQQYRCNTNLNEDVFDIMKLEILEIDLRPKTSSMIEEI